jgi:hypothetical protein
VVAFPQVSPPKSCMHLSFPHTCYMPHPAHSSRFDYPNNIWWWVQAIKLIWDNSVNPFLHTSCTRISWLSFIRCNNLKSHLMKLNQKMRVQDICRNGFIELCDYWLKCVLDSVYRLKHLKGNSCHKFLFGLINNKAFVVWRLVREVCIEVLVCILGLSDMFALLLAKWRVK